MTAVITYMTEFGQGYYARHPEVDEQRNWQRWYHGIYDSLLPTASVDNGRMLIADQDLMRLPLFRLASDFTANAAISELPAASGHTAAGQYWLDANQRMLDRALRRGTRHWAVIGQGVWVAEPGAIRAVDPIFYYRVGPPDDEDATVGHIVAYEYREKGDDERQNPHIILPDNRIKVIKLDSGMPYGTVQTFNFSASRVIGEPLDQPQQVDGLVICTAGLMDGWYGAARDIASRALLALSLLDSDINRHRNRPRYLPSIIASQIKAELEERQRVNAVGERDPANPNQTVDLQPRQQRNAAEGGSVGLTAIKAALDRIVRPVIPIEDMDPPQAASDDLMTDASFEELRTLLDMFFMISGLPPSSFGIGIGRGESGVARERAQDAASARIRAYRNDLAECLPRLVAAAGMPGSVSFNWSAPPFQDRSARQNELLQLLAAGVLTAEEVRAASGWADEMAQMGMAPQMPQMPAAPTRTGDAGSAAQNPVATPRPGGMMGRITGMLGR